MALRPCSDGLQDTADHPATWAHICDSLPHAQSVSRHASIPPTRRSHGSLLLRPGRHHARRRLVAVRQRCDLQAHLRVLGANNQAYNILDVPTLDLRIVDGHKLVSALYLPCRFAMSTEDRACVHVSARSVRSSQVAYHAHRHRWRYTRGLGGSIGSHARNEDVTFRRHAEGDANAHFVCLGHLCSRDWLTRDNHTLVDTRNLRRRRRLE